ncbi:hypothetical protein os1_32930 [Comamonadaceae bacterium OS-1]|nr:hypothetical protein os1_32930 [Comamonadaceae bacterium OS-1]
MSNDDTSQRQVAQRIATSITSDDERQRLLKWVRELTRIRDGKESMVTKGRSALMVTFSEGTAWPIVKLLAMEIRRLAWDERGTKWRAGFFVAITAGILTGGQSAGIAALGGAIGVPLWLVLGAGGSFLAMLYEELVPKNEQTPSSSKPSNDKESAPKQVIDVESSVIPTASLHAIASPSLIADRAIRAGDKLHCRVCRYEREITQTWLDTLSRRYEPTRAGRLTSLSADLLKRMTCSQCHRRDGLELQMIEDDHAIVQYELCSACGGDGGLSGRCSRCFGTGFKDAQR